MQKKRHPFYDAIIAHGPENFNVETLINELTLDEANREEIRLIAEIPDGMGYNLAPGGSNGSLGGITFWKELSKDPEARAAFIKKASEARQKAGNDYTALTEAAAKWRKNNPRGVWKIAHRGQRVAKRKDKRPKKEIVELTLKERLLRKHNLNKVKQREVTKIWANRTIEQKIQIWKNIATTAKERNSKLTKEERYSMVAEARKNIDRSVQGPAASKGIKAWWAELKKDPVAYQAYVDKRTNTLLKGLEAQGLKIRTKKYENL